MQKRSPSYPFDTGPELVDSYVLIRVTLGGEQYDVYIDRQALRQHAQKPLDTRSALFAYTSSIAENIISAADRKRANSIDENIINIDEADDIRHALRHEAS